MERAARERAAAVAHDEVAARLSGKRCLIILDDVWDKQQPRPFQRLAGGGADLARALLEGGDPAVSAELALVAPCLGVSVALYGGAAALAPPDADTIAVIAAHGWSTNCAVAADGGAWWSASDTRYTPGERCEHGGYDQLASSGGSHTVTRCPLRVLARCKDCEHGTYDAVSSACACEGNFIGLFIALGKGKP